MDPFAFHKNCTLTHMTEQSLPFEERPQSLLGLEGDKTPF